MERYIILTSYTQVMHVYNMYLNLDILMGMSVSSDVTILNKCCYVRRASVTLIPRVKASAGNTKIMGSSLGNWVNSHLCSSKTFGYCILQIAYSSAVMWSSVRKHAGFGWLQIKCKMWRACRRSVVFGAICRLICWKLQPSLEMEVPAHYSNHLLQRM